MSNIADRIGSWLWSVVQSYEQPRLVYNDALTALSAMPTLQPKTAVYTYENGQTALLLSLSGPVTVEFRGGTYRYPVEIWLPLQYGRPLVPVMAYVKPQLPGSKAFSDMAIRPGQHVGIDGRIYHPYLRDWGARERSNVAGFVQILQAIFTKEPPLIRRNATNGAPELPSKISLGSQPTSPTLVDRSVDGMASRVRGPPPLPSKPSHSQESRGAGYHPDSHLSSNGPPIPPLPSDHRARPSRCDAPPPLPPATPCSRLASISQPDQMRSAASSVIQSSQYNGPYTTPALRRPDDGAYAAPASPVSGTLAMYHNERTPLNTYLPQQQYGNGLGQGQGLPPRSNAGLTQAAVVRPAPVVDLLSDPFDVSLSPAVHSGPPPPIPPNPEKEHLLQALSERFVHQAHAKIKQAEEAMAPLSAQHQAMLEAHARLQAEVQQLSALDTVLSTNERILHQNIIDCQSVIDSSKQMSQPDIDTVLVAPSIAAQQLWNVCAEEAGIAEAMWCLQRAMNAGRIGGADFIRLTRSLARERFLKLALARKIGRGLGLDA